MIMLGEEALDAGDTDQKVGGSSPSERARLLCRWRRVFVSAGWAGGVAGSLYVSL
jgi:hypothetical protein